jgi:pyridoxal 5'-phosphate synthase pdxS subunit
MCEAVGVVTQGVVTQLALSVLACLVATVWVLGLCLTRVRRLHRLHIRVDAARAGLEAALNRRVSAAARAGVEASAAAPNLDPEDGANALSRALARLDRAALPVQLRAELSDAEQLLVVARRVHNDAVRDTLGLRSLRLVRWLRLAGTAPMPAYFEMADPQGVADVRSGVTVAGLRGIAVSSDQQVPAPSSAGQQQGTARVKRGMAEMLKGGVIMDVVDAEQAKIAEDAGAVAVMALERVPADIRAQGGVARMSDPDMIQGIIDAVSIPVMAKARIGHFVEAQVLQALGVDYIDESEVLTPADEANHIDKWPFAVPFVCGATNLGEALRRLSEGAAMIRSKGEAGTGNVVEATRHMRSIRSDIRRLAGLDEAELYGAAKELRAPVELVTEVARAGKLPVVLFTAGGIATPADAAMMMQLGAEGVFVGSGIFKSGDPAQRAEAIVKATTFFDDPSVIAKVSRGLGEAMVGINVAELPADQRYASRGW